MVAKMRGHLEIERRGNTLFGRLSKARRGNGLFTMGSGGCDCEENTGRGRSGGGRLLLSLPKSVWPFIVQSWSQIDVAG